MSGKPLVVPGGPSLLLGGLGAGKTGATRLLPRLLLRGTIPSPGRVQPALPFAVEWSSKCGQSGCWSHDCTAEGLPPREGLSASFTPVLGSPVLGRPHESPGNWVGGKHPPPQPPRICPRGVPQVAAWTCSVRALCLLSLRLAGA